MKLVKSTLLAFTFCLAIAGCVKDKHARPNISLKNAETYTAADATTDTSTLVKFGLVADKTEYGLRTFNVSVTFDTDPTVYNVETLSLGSEQAAHFERDITIKTHPTSTVEKWIFTVTDDDGNRAQKAITLTVKE